MQKKSPVDDNKLEQHTLFLGAFLVSVCGSETFSHNNNYLASFSFFFIIV